MPTPKRRGERVFGIVWMKRVQKCARHSCELEADGVASHAESQPASGSATSSASLAALDGHEIQPLGR